MIADLNLYVVAAIVLAGSIFSVLGALGLVRFPDVYSRIHAASKAGLVGAGLLLLAVAIASLQLEIVLRTLIGIVFLMLTTPVSAHLLARASYAGGYPTSVITKIDDLKD
jgi:multicomponent Na+:H+ antiporter subunit G